MKGPIMAFPVLRFVLMASLAVLVKKTQAVAVVETDPQYWYDRSQDELAAALASSEGFNKNTADGMILFIGDGMSISTVTGVRIWKGQKQGNTGEESKLVYDDWPHFGYSKTYNTNSQVPDSAGTATAYLTGVKTKRRVLGLDSGIEVGDCASTIGHEINSILKMAKNNGMPVGIVTTTRITHASPSGAYAHVPERDWEADSQLPTGTTMCKDIARQLVEDNDIDVLMGGGRNKFMMKTQTDESGLPGSRDNLDLIAAWQDKYKNRATAEYITTRDQLLNLDTDGTDYVLGLYSFSEMEFDIDRPADQPTLAEMTEKAIQILKRKSAQSGGRYFLFVEGGRVDHGHHFGQGKHAITDGLALEQAIQKAKSLTTSNTLMVLSSDHSHCFSFSGYPQRGNSIFGKVFSDDKGYPYTTLAYHTGYIALVQVALSFTFTGHRPDITNTDTEKSDYAQQSYVATSSAAHGGEDVAIFATGPWSHLIHSVHEQNYIPHVMMYAGCVGDYFDNCRNSLYLKGAVTDEDREVPARFRTGPKMTY